MLYLKYLYKNFEQLKKRCRTDVNIYQNVYQAIPTK